MIKSVQTRLHSRATALIAILTLAALLIAPVCAPLCAAKMCSSSSLGGEHCHDQEAMGQTPGQAYAAATKTCGARELLAVLAKSNDQLASSAEARHVPAQLEMYIARAEYHSSLDSRYCKWLERRSPSVPTNSLLETTILRI